MAILSLATLLSAPSFGSQVKVTADTDSFVHVRVDHRQDIKGRHTIYILNDTQYPRLYNFTVKICVLEWNCQEKNGVVSLNPGEQASFPMDTVQTVLSGSSTTLKTKAETIVNGDGYWNAKKEGVLEIVN